MRSNSYYLYKYLTIIVLEHMMKVIMKWLARNLSLDGRHSSGKKLSLLEGVD
jgi:hypothetical protein